MGEDTSIGGTNFNSRVTEPVVREVAAALDSLKELVSTHVNSLNLRIVEKDEAVDKLISELDRRYQQRFEAQELAVRAAFAAQERAMSAAFAAQEKLYETAFTASKQAIDKAEAAQKDKNAMTNEFRGQLADQAATFMPRKEVEAIGTNNRLLYDNLKQDLYIQREEMLKTASKREDEIKKEIQFLREAGSHHTGASEQGREDKASRNWIIGTALSIGFFVIAVVTLIVRLGVPH